MAPAVEPRLPGQKRRVNPSNIAVGGHYEVGVRYQQPSATLRQSEQYVRSDYIRATSRGPEDTNGRQQSTDIASGGSNGLVTWWYSRNVSGFDSLVGSISINTRAVLLFTAAEVENSVVSAGVSPGTAGLLGGMAGGVVQAYATMGFCTTMKTAEITRHKAIVSGAEKPPSTWKVFGDIYRREGLSGVNKGVNAVALRQMTNWGSRMGLARLAEQGLRRLRGKGEAERLGAFDKILASSVGGALATWNQPIEVVRVEMQSMAKQTSANRPAKLTVLNTLAYVYKEGGIKALYRGVTPRIGLGIWQTICMVSFADFVKIWVANFQKK
ncbi:MAG: hypothetical protein CYPHOPRED_002693 [Cyphobasidiales sp. Tagirdzhanova-0007]|nr:MAG: hypothetical protein CYPHOPRED_002693 [Cyphobasidiales sp. Tagirdzhanova-0007]